MRKFLSRFKSPVVWAQLILLTAYALRVIGVYDISNDTLSALQDMITAFFAAFAAFNNPTTQNKF